MKDKQMKFKTQIEMVKCFKTVKRGLQGSREVIAGQIWDAVNHCRSDLIRKLHEYNKVIQVRSDQPLEKKM